MKRVIKIFGIFLLALGLGLGSWVLYWDRQTDNQAAASQGSLREQLSRPKVPELLSEVKANLTPPSDNPSFDFPETRVPHNPSIPLGAPLGTLRFLDFEWIVVQGVGVEELKMGPGHMPWTSMPGEEGNTVISGHRTTYGGPFHDLHLLEVGDLVSFTYPDGKVIKYEVSETLIVKPTDVWVVDDREGDTLTFTTCNPIGSARERLVVYFNKPLDNDLASGYNVRNPA